MRPLTPITGSSLRTAETAGITVVSQDKPFYDVVYGPVSLFPQFLVIADADQISFHTDAALRALSTVAIRSHGTPIY